MTINNYIPFINSNRVRLNQYYIFGRVVVYNLTQTWASGFYKLVVYKMNWKNSQELPVTLEYCEGKSNKQK